MINNILTLVNFIMTFSLHFENLIPYSDVISGWNGGITVFQPIGNWYRGIFKNYGNPDNIYFLYYHENEVELNILDGAWILSNSEKNEFLIIDGNKRMSRIYNNKNIIDKINVKIFICVSTNSFNYDGWKNLGTLKKLH